MKQMPWAASALVAVIASACAPVAPTVDPAQIQASAVAAASTMIALTQEAVPTPTDTPVPSPTPLPSPTFPPPPTIEPPTVEPTKSAGDDCNHLFDLAEDRSKRSPVKINNLNKAPFSGSLWMSQKNAFGQCGYVGFQIPKGQSITLQLPQTGSGPCWWGGGWVNGPEPSTPSGGPFCWNGDLKWELDIGPDVIRLRQ